MINSHFFYSQNKIKGTLEICIKDSITHTYLTYFKSQNNHLTTNKIVTKKDSIINTLKNKGYYTISIDSLSIKNNIHTYYIDLGEKLNLVKIHLQKDIPIDLLKKYGAVNKNVLTIKIELISFFLSSLTNDLVEKGKIFTEIMLTNLSIKKNILFTQLEINHSKKRIVDKIVIKGLENFPKNYSSHYFSDYLNKTVNKKLINEVSTKTKLLDFITELKTPELLFKKDSTHLYIFVKKKSANSFDGLINFSNSNNNTIEFNGYLDLKLKNIFNTGEQLIINWQNNGDNKQLFNTSIDLPYIANTKISTKATFDLYKHDTIYINSNTHLAINYPINKKITTGVFYSNVISNTTSTYIENDSLNSFSSNHFGGIFQYHSLKKSKYNFLLQVSYGNRKMEDISTPQYKINFSTSITIPLQNKFQLYLKNENGYLLSPTLLTNELFQIGGVNSIRGFKNQSIFTSAYTYIITEGRYLTKTDSFFFNILDVGILKKLNDIEKIIGLGLGYQYKLGNNLIKLSYSLGTQLNNQLNFNNSILNINFLTFF